MKINFKQSPKALDYKIPGGVLQKYLNIDSLQQYALQNEIKSINDSLNDQNREPIQHLITGFKNVVDKYRNNAYSLYQNMSLYRGRYADFKYLGDGNQILTHMEYLTQIAALEVDTTSHLTFSKSLYNLSLLDSVAAFTNNAFNISNGQSSVSKYVSDVVDTFRANTTPNDTLYNKNAFAAKLGRPVIILKSDKDLGIKSQVPSPDGFFYNTGNDDTYRTSESAWCSDFHKYYENGKYVYVYYFYEPLTIQQIDQTPDPGFEKRVIYDKNSSNHVKVRSWYNDTICSKIEGAKIEIYIDRYFAAASNTAYTIGTVINNGEFVPVNTGYDNHFDSGYKEEEFQHIREKESYPGGDENLKNDGYYYAGIVKPQINQSYFVNSHCFRVELIGSLGNFHSFYANVAEKDGSGKNASNTDLNCFAMLEYTEKKVPLLMRKTVISDNIVLFQFPEYLIKNNPDILTHYIGWTLAIPNGMKFIKAYQTRPYYNDYSISNNAVAQPANVSDCDIFPLGYNGSYKIVSPQLSYDVEFSSQGSYTADYFRETIIEANQTRLGLLHLNLEVSRITFNSAANNLKGFTLALHDASQPTAALDGYGIAITYLKDVKNGVQSYYVLLNACGPSSATSKDGLWYYPGTSGSGYFIPQTFIGGIKLLSTDLKTKYTVTTEVDGDEIAFKINNKSAGSIPIISTDDVDTYHKNDRNYRIYLDKKTHNLVFRPFKISNYELGDELETVNKKTEINSEYMCLTYIPQTTKGGIKNITVKNGGIVESAEFDTGADLGLDLNKQYTTFKLTSTYIQKPT